MNLLSNSIRTPVATHTGERTSLLIAKLKNGRRGLLLSPSAGNETGTQLVNLQQENREWLLKY